MTQTYDPRCYDLAALFLSDSPTLDDERHRKELAAYIQRQIESWLRYEEAKEPAEQGATP